MITFFDRAVKEIFVIQKNNSPLLLRPKMKNYGKQPQKEQSIFEYLSGKQRIITNAFCCA